jgi:nucleoid-associated protein YgaU
VKLARAPFTIVGSGETITDVARRVYGTADDADMLWRANRDVVGEPGAPLAAGTVLRTPARSAR